MVNRPNWTDVAANLLRDYNTIGNPGSGIFLPLKPDLRAYFLQMEGFLNDIYDKASSYLTAVGGTANAATAVATPAVDAHAAGQSYWYTPTATNTAAGPTLAISGLAALTLADADGVDIPVGGVLLGRTYKLVNDGTKLRVIAQRDLSLYKVLDADDSPGQNVATAQPWFATAGGVALPVGNWFLEAFLWWSRSAGVASHTTSFLFGGTATYTIDWSAIVNTGDVATLATPTFLASAVATATQVKAASVSASEQLLARVTARLNVTVTGTFIPQAIYSVAPGGAPTAKRGSFIRLTPRPGGLTSVGTWA